MTRLLLSIAFVLALLVAAASASSHSEAPGIAKTPGADLTDLYAFRSYEEGRDDRLVILANAYPLQFPGGGPNYFTLSDDHFFEINIGTDGDAEEDITFQFYFGADLGGDIGNYLSPDDDDCDDDTIVTESKHGGFELQIGDESVAVPLKVLGALSSTDRFPDTLNWREYYQINYMTGGRNTARTPLTKTDGSERFEKPFDYTGEKVFGSSSDYEDYARTFIHETNIPGCSEPARVFVGQRKEPFHVSLGRIFDLVNFVPVSSFGGGIADCEVKNNDLENFNVATLAIELPMSCVRRSGSQDDAVISVWADSRKLIHDDGGNHVPGTQVSRMGQPLVNELLIGLRDKFRFNLGHPSGDGALATYVTHPTLPAILNLLFLQAVRDELGDQSISQLQPDNIPRQDLAVTFLTGVPGLTQRSDVVGSEQLRLNLSVPVVSRDNQNRFGVLGDDVAGFPNGRRPGDDVVDIALRVMMGALCHTGIEQFQCDEDNAPFGTVPFTDGAIVEAGMFGDRFPFFNTPNPGSVTDPDPGSCDLDGSAASFIPIFNYLLVASLVFSSIAVMF